MLGCQQQQNVIFRSSEDKQKKMPSAIFSVSAQHIAGRDESTRHQPNCTGEPWAMGIESGEIVWSRAPSINTECASFWHISLACYALWSCVRSMLMLMWHASASNTNFSIFVLSHYTIASYVLITRSCWSPTFGTSLHITNENEWEDRIERNSWNILVAAEWKHVKRVSKCSNDMLSHQTRMKKIQISL